jgi:hypothetical protein
MADPTLTPNSKKENDDRYNPYLQNERETQAGSSYSSAGIDQLAAYANDPANASQKTLSAGEQNPVEIPKSPSNTPEIPFTGTGGRGNEKQTFFGKISGPLKKRSPLTVLIGLLLTGAFGLSLLTPGMLLIQFKETLADKFNDQLTAMDMRSTALLKKKLGKTTTKGVCGTTVTIRCKYRTLGDRHIKRLENAGFTIEGDKDIFGRTKPTSFTREGRTIAAPDMLNEARTDSSLRSALRHGYNPKFAAFSDAIAAKVRGDLGLKKTKNITSSTDEEKMKEQLKDNASGKTAAGDGAPSSGKDADGNTTYTDASGEAISQAEFDNLNKANAEIENRSKLASGVKKAGLKAGLKGALTSTAFGLGAVDTICTVWTTLRIASFAAKVYGARQLIRYSYQFMNTADVVKAGDAAPEEVAYLSKILTSVNSEGKSATDSPGYSYAAFGDTFRTGDFDTSANGRELSDAAVSKNAIINETSRYVNGQIIPGNVIGKLVSKVGASDFSAADSTCGVVKSWQGQAIIFTAAIGGAIAAFFSGGTSAAAGAALQVGAMATAAVALAIVTPKLMDMAKGDLITGDENGNEAGNAIVSGMGGYNAQASQARGLAVLNKDDAVEYAQQTDRTVASYNEMDRAELSPFDATNKNTFLGSFVNSIIPYTAKMSSGTSAITSTTSLVSSSFASLLSPASSYAAKAKKAEFNYCSDPEYTKDSLAADPFCNLRYGVSLTSLLEDPDTVLDYMENGGYIEKDSTDGAPGGANGSVYQEYIDQCIERKTAIGDTFTESSAGSGQNCIQGKSGANEERNTMFRLFYIDVSVNDGMDSDFDAGNAGLNTGAGANLRISTFNMRGAGHTGGVFEGRLTKSINLMERENFDIIGMQELTPPQRNSLMKQRGGTFDIYPCAKCKNSKHSVENSIMWNKTKFKLVKGGYIPNLKYFNGAVLNAPWVLLEDIDASDGKTGQQFYVLNTHDPAFTVNAIHRMTNAQNHEKFIQDLRDDTGLPVMMTGDFNAGYAQRPGTPNITYQAKDVNLTYCIMTASGNIRDALDVSLNRPRKCPNKPKGYGDPIDHIFLTKELGATNYTKVEGGYEKNGSDHPTYFADITIPGLGTPNSEAGSTGGLTWPLDKKWWKSARADFLNSHGMSSGTFTSPYRVGIASDISSPPDGTPIQAMLGGKVYAENTCYIGIESKVSGGTLKIAYGHSVNHKVKEGDTVTSGQVISGIGSTCNSTGGHLHVDMVFNGKHICPQDVFLAIDKNQQPDFGALTKRGVAPCGRV